MQFDTHNHNIHTQKENFIQTVIMVRRSQRKTSFEVPENNSLDPIDLSSGSELEIIDNDDLKSSSPPSPKVKAKQSPKKESSKKYAGKKESPVKKTTKAKKMVALSENSPKKMADKSRILNPSKKINISVLMEKHPEPEVSDSLSEEYNSDADVSIVQVVEVPSESKFLRKRSKKQDHIEQAKRKRADNADLDDADDSAAESVTFHDAILEQIIPEPTGAPSVVEIESESEDELVLAPVSKLSSSTKKSTIRLLYNSSNNMVEKPHDETVNLDTVTVHELVGTSDLVETFQFNFSIDLEFFLTYLHPEFSKNNRKITFISGNSQLAAHPLRKMIETKFNISEVVAPLPNRFASHHSKMMINFYLDDSVEVVIMTSNLTQLDFGGLTQAVWRSGRLQLGDTTASLGKRFKRDLSGYLAKYGNARIDNLVDRLAKYNFNPVEVELVASAPGVYSLDKLGSKDEAYGYGKLRQVLHRNDLLIKNSKKSHNLLAQVTSIAYPYSSKKGNTASVFSHLLCPLVFSSWTKQLEPGSAPSQEHQREFNYEPHIVYPTAKEVASSNFGYLSGSALHFKYSGSVIHQNQYTQNIKPYLRKWGPSSNVTGRESVAPHVKYYACDNGDNWKTLRWVLVGSHNLSKQAWGFPQNKIGGETYEVSSYELSVLVVGHKKGLVPVYNQDISTEPNVNPVRFPFTLPPTKYGTGDKPWSAGEDCGLMKDRWGNLHHGGYSL